MKDSVFIEAFSDNVLFSKREILLDDYMEESCIEIDDKKYITENKIDKVKIHIPLFDEYSTNYYDKNGFPVKFITLINECVSRVELCHKDSMLGFVNIEFSQENSEIQVSIRGDFPVFQKRLNIIGGCHFNGKIQELFNIEVQDVFNDEFVITKDQLADYTDFFVTISDNGCQILRLE